jgi:tol-pal system protein YbgF
MNLSIKPIALILLILIYPTISLANNGLSVEIKQLKGMVTSLQNRVNHLEREVELLKRQSKTPQVVISKKLAKEDEKQALKKISMEQLYNDAFQALQATDYDKAGALFKKFIEDYPNDSLRPNAEYWLAESYFVKNNYPQAIKHYVNIYQSYKSNIKAFDSFYKVGLSFLRMKQADKACEVFVKLKAESNISPSLKSRVERYLKNCNGAD